MARFARSEVSSRSTLFACSSTTRRATIVSDERVHLAACESKAKRRTKSTLAATCERDPIHTAMKDDLGKYIERRKRTDKAFAKGFDRGYARFRNTVIDRTGAPTPGRNTKPKCFEP